MSRRNRQGKYFLLMVLGGMFLGAGYATAAETENVNDPAVQKRIEQLTGATGEFHAQENVYKVNFPRADIKPVIAGVKATPPMGLTAWAAFQNVGNEAMVMGDTVLTEDQVNPVMSVALENGLEVTALHNHFAYDAPRVMFMHIGGMGNLDKLAAAIGKVFQKLKEPVRKEAAVQLDPAHTTLNPEKITAMIGQKGQLNSGVYKVTIGRTTTMHGQKVGTTMGINTWAAFVGSDEQAVVDGDFAMRESEVQGVLKALRSSGIHIVALHNHMLGDTPRIMFLHFWGVGSTTHLARGLKKALDVVGKE